MCDFDIGFFVGLIEGEGCFTFGKSHYKPKNGDRPSLHPSIKITNTNRSLLEHTQQILQDRWNIKTKIYPHYKNNQIKRPQWKAQYSIQISRQKDLEFLCCLLMPWLITKKEQCKLVIKFLLLRFDKAHLGNKLRKTGNKEYIIYNKMKELNRRGIACQ